MALKPHIVRIEHGLAKHTTVVRARNADEAISLALHLLGLQDKVEIRASAEESQYADTDSKWCV